MTVISIIYFIIAIEICGLVTVFVVTSWQERKPRAAGIGLLGLVVFGMVYFGVFSLCADNYVLMIPLLLIILGVGLFFMPIGKVEVLKVGEIVVRVDERDVMFARASYKPGTERYDTYYAMRPGNKEIDDKIRKLPRLLDPGGKYYDPIRSRKVDDVFDEVREYTAKVDGDVNSDRIEVNSEEMTRDIKEMVLAMGAAEVGVGKLNQDFVYSHVGRGPEPWGEEIVNDHKFVVVFSLEMDYRCVEAAPQLEITEETARNYLLGAQIAVKVAEFVRGLGYPARGHISGSNYQVMLPAAGYEAGLGELGRHGYLISPTYGSRIRLGAVTTDLPLVADSPIVFGVQDFCSRCMKCANNCPAGAISTGEKEEIRGVQKWQLNIEGCYRYWRTVGTDCGLCMKVCPFSHPPTLTHNLVRLGIRRSSFARTMSVWGDDLFYGRKII